MVGSPQQTASRDPLKALGPKEPKAPCTDGSKEALGRLVQDWPLVGGRTLRKGVFLPSKHLLSAFYDTPF